jgi:hypothetical protein
MRLIANDDDFVLPAFRPQSFGGSQARLSRADDDDPIGHQL